jgi:hypothetical protein
MENDQNVWEISWSTLYKREVSIKKNINRLRAGKFFKLVPKQAFVLDLFSGVAE